MSVRPSFRPEKFPGICRRSHGGNGLKLYMLMYRDLLHNRLVQGHGLLIFVILALFWLCETGHIWGFGHFLENAWREWPEILHSDVSWQPSELISSGSRSVIFVILALFWLSETGQIWGFRVYLRERLEGMAWNMVCCCILTTFRTE